ncbi:hypothetical protein HYU09_05425 [Candidatus Woesearchaeota archaeon]|nr:hypothetical protein [Candidatus Woesearchaeota archaeon]
MREPVYSDLERLCEEGNEDGVVSVLRKHGFLFDGFLLKRIKREKEVIDYIILDDPTYCVTLPKDFAEGFEKCYRRYRAGFGGFAPYLASILSGMGSAMAGAYFSEKLGTNFQTLIISSFLIGLVAAGFARKIAGYFEFKNFNKAINQFNSIISDYGKEGKKHLDYPLINDLLLAP